MGRFSKFLNQVSGIAGVLSFAGVPTVSALVAGASGYWTSLHEGNALSVFLIVLVVFVTCLWSGIGLVWLWFHSRSGGRRRLDCAWGLVVDSCFITFAPDSERFCQVSINFRNMLAWPIRVEVEDQYLEIDNRTPDQPMNTHIQTFILLQNPPLSLNLATYSKGSLPENKVMHGKIRLVCHYGHPDIGHTRTLRRWLQFEQSLPQPPQTLPGLIMSMPALPIKVALMVGPEKEDEDSPYRPK